MKKNTNIKFYIWLLIGLVGIYWILNHLDLMRNLMDTLLTLTLPFILGAGLAFILNIPLKMFEKYLTKLTKQYHKWYRLLSIFLSFLLVLLVISFIVFLVLPDLQDTITSFIEVVPDEITKLINWINAYFAANPQIMDGLAGLNIDLDSMRSQAINTIQNMASNIVASLFSVVTGIVNSIFNMFVAIVFAIFILSSKEKLAFQFKKVIYAVFQIDWANYIVDVFSKANTVFSNFISGQFIEAFVNGLLFYFGMWIFGFPYRLSISVMTGALSLIPIFGAIIGGALGAILIAVVSLSKGIWFIIFTVAVQQIESNIFYPRVVGNSVGLPGIWVMFAVTVGGGLFGLPGMLLSVPTLSLLYQLVRDTVNYKIDEKKIKLHP